MKRWSKLQSRLYLITDQSIDFQVHCAVYRMDSQYGGEALPRYLITLGKEIVFDYPKQFVNKDGAIKTCSAEKPNRFYPYKNDISDISALIREYIDTPQTELLSRQFEDDHWGLINILRAADRRIGTRRLAALKRKTHNKAALKIIEARENVHRKQSE